MVEALRAAQPQLVLLDCQMMRRLLCGCNMLTFDPRQTESKQDRVRALNPWMFNPKPFARPAIC